MDADFFSSLMVGDGQVSRQCRLVLDALPDGITVHRPDGAIVLANQEAGDLFGVSPARMIGMRCEALFHSGTPGCPHEEVVTTAKPLRFGQSLGGRGYVVTVSPLLDEQGGVSGYVRSIRKSEGGRAFSGFAHKIGTPLNIISGYAEYLLMRLKPEQAGHKELQTILEQTRRISEAVRHMRNFSGELSPAPAREGLEELLSGVLSLVRDNLVGMGVRADWRLADGPLPAIGEAGRLKQVLIHLLLEVARAVGEGGHLYLVAGWSDRGGGEISVELAAESGAGERGIAAALLVAEEGRPTGGGIGAALALLKPVGWELVPVTEGARRGAIRVRMLAG